MIHPCCCWFGTFHLIYRNLSSQAFRPVSLTSISPGGPMARLRPGAQWTWATTDCRWKNPWNSSSDLSPGLVFCGQWIFHIGDLHVDLSGWSPSGFFIVTNFQAFTVTFPDECEANHPNSIKWSSYGYVLHMTIYKYITHIYKYATYVHIILDPLGIASCGNPEAE